jgi:hypothetical protein
MPTPKREQKHWPWYLGYLLREMLSLVGPKQVTLLILSNTKERPVQLRNASRDESPYFWIVFVQILGKVKKL